MLVGAPIDLKMREYPLDRSADGTAQIAMAMSRIPHAIKWASSKTASLPAFLMETKGDYVIDDLGADTEDLHQQTDPCFQLSSFRLGTPESIERMVSNVGFICTHGVMHPSSVIL